MDKPLIKILKDYLLKDLERGEIILSPPIKARFSPHSKDMNITKCYLKESIIFISCDMGEVKCDPNFYGTIVNRK